jgi:uncharacterized protein YbbC (DUF1343 family)
MRWVRVSVLAVVWVLLAAVAGQAQPTDWAGLDQAVRDAVTAGEVPGAVVVVGQRDSILYRKAMGSRALMPQAEPISLDTVYDVASLTKVVATTPAVLALWEQGRIDLDAPIGRYLVEFRGRAHHDVTTRRLLTHTAGLSDLPPPEASRRGFPAALAIIAQASLAAPPGSVFRYSDTGFIVLGELVRRVSGEPLDRFVHRRFFVPLKMNATAFKPPASWRGRIAPTEALDGGMLRGVVHDGNARLLGGVAGHAGLFSTADDLARFCRMLLAGGILDGRRVLRDATVREMFAPHLIGETTRALGWDMASPYSRTLGSFFPMGSAGHTGFTGTSIWLDPATRTCAIILSNRVHPGGKGSVVELRRRVSATVGAVLFANGSPPTFPDGSDDAPHVARASGEPRPRTRTGLDQLSAQNFSALAGRSIGLVTNQTGVDAEGRRAVDLLAAAPGVKLKALFSPEHGLGGQLDAKVPHGRDAATGIQIWSLYGAERRPSATMLDGIEVLVFDIQDVGVRYYTYLTTLVYVLEEAGRRGIPVVVLDRPNPITGRLVEGPVTDGDLRSFTAPHTIPVRTGLTMGEFARLVVGERRLPVSLTVIPLEGWQRARWFDETGLPWVNPSPNIRSLNQALLYAGVGLLEATNLSVGRGTDTPFEVIGAPWITDPAVFAEALTTRGLPGVTFQPASFTPSSSVYAGQMVHGVRLTVTDREAFRPVRTGLAVGQELWLRYPAYFRPAAIQNLLVNRNTIWSFLRAESLSRIWSWAEADRTSFLQRRASYLIYR